MTDLAGNKLAGSVPAQSRPGLHAVEARDVEQKVAEEQRAPTSANPTWADSPKWHARRERARQREKEAAEAAAAAAAAFAETLELSATGPDVAAAALRPRHYLAIGSFVLCVLLPFFVATTYLYARAADQYHSEGAFSIRSEGMAAAAAGLLGAITQISSGNTSDAEILFDYIHSQKIVETINAELDLYTIYNKASDDFVFALGENATIEHLVSYWGRMVDLSMSEGIIRVRTRAFTPEDAQRITLAILAESSALVNELSEQAREDAVRFARDELAEAQKNLSVVRKRLGEFRSTNRIVDPSADVAGQMGLLSALQAELAQALVERDMLLSYAGEDDQRVVQSNRRISAITDRIEDERQNLGVRGVNGEALPDIIGTYEELLVEIEFANAAYTQTLGAFSAARAEARRQSRYLTAHIEPTRAQEPLYPKRMLLSGLTGMFLLLAWSILMLIYYNIRDNR